MMLLLFSGAASAQSNLSVIDGRISQLEQEIRRLTGKIEEQSYQIKQLENELERRVSDAEIRLNDLEKSSRNGSAVSSYNAPDVISTDNGMENQSSADIASPSSPSPRHWEAPKADTLGQISNQIDPATREYEEAFATLRNGNYDLAEQQFQAFLDKNTDHSLKNNAQYWLAETYYVRNQYDRAAKGFATAYQADPKGQKAPDNLLKLGLSLAGLGKNEDACIAFSQLLSSFKDGPRTIVGRAELETSRLGCSN